MRVKVAPPSPLVLCKIFETLGLGPDLGFVVGF